MLLFGRMKYLNMKLSDETEDEKPGINRSQEKF
jgi:hypothetical protein